MVAVIKTGHSIRRILNYNENKVKEGLAECISAVNYPMELESLSFTYKLNRLLKQAALNENVTRNSVHVSLNFDPSEKLSTSLLKEIADSYMEKIGFGKQPYLVYQHFDAGHPHIHIVSLKVRADGARIDTQNIGRNQSEKARKEIENAYGLVRAETKVKQYELKSAYTQKVQYGRSDSRRAISNVLDQVLNTYKYTSLAELNAVLKQYNVMADRGGENSRINKHQGLYYRILDEYVNPVGVPIKASSFYNSPTLKYLEGKFLQNENARKPHIARVKNLIDFTLLKHAGISLSNLIELLKKEGIQTVIRQNSTGLIYGVTYVDQRTKCVFNGSTLGKEYSAKAIQERCETEQKQMFQTTLKRESGAKLSEKQNLSLSTKNAPVHSGIETLTPQAEKTISLASNSVLESLLKPEQTADYLPTQLTNKPKKKKRISKRL